MGKRRGKNESENLSPELVDPLRRLEAELSRLKKTPADRASKRDVDVARLLDALRQVGEALSPLTDEKPAMAAPQPAPVLAFRRRPQSEGEGSAEPARRIVFLFEPEPSLNLYLQRVLAAAGFTAVSLPNVETSVERARIQAPDVVILDQLVLRPVEHEHALVRFKMEPALARAPVVLLRSLEDEESYHPFGIAATVTKPIDDGELILVLERLTTAPVDPLDSGDADESALGGARRVVRG